MDTIERKLDVAAREAAFVMRVLDDPKSPFNAMEPIRDVYFRKGAEWMREELTQWHDPNKPPAKGHTVLLKIKIAKIMSNTLSAIMRAGVGTVAVSGAMTT